MGDVIAHAVDKVNDVMVAANSDGQGREILTKGVDPAWSPDGKRIAFSRESGTWQVDWREDICLINMQTRAEGCLTTVDKGHMFRREPKWSPDGTMIAYQDIIGHQQYFEVILRVINLQGEVVCTAETRDYDYFWLP